jgi:hypothetical protein
MRIVDACEVDYLIAALNSKHFGLIYGELPGVVCPATIFGLYGRWSTLLIRVLL